MRAQHFYDDPQLLAPNTKNDDKVETPLGVGRISEIRNTPSGTIFLVVIQEGGFGRGYSDVFRLDEIAPLQQKELTPMKN